MPRYYHLKLPDDWSDREDYQELEEKIMNTITNTSLSVIATGLIAFGASIIKTDLRAGVIQIVLGIAVYAIYEYLPQN